MIAYPCAPEATPGTNGQAGSTDPPAGYGCAEGEPAAREVTGSDRWRYGLNPAVTKAGTLRERITTGPRHVRHRGSDPGRSVLGGSGSGRGRPVMRVDQRSK